MKEIKNQIKIQSIEHSGYSYMWSPSLTQLSSPLGGAADTMPLFIGLTSCLWGFLILLMKIYF